MVHASRAPKQHLDRFIRFAGLAVMINRHTDRPTTSLLCYVSNNSPHVALFAGLMVIDAGKHFKLYSMRFPYVFCSYRNSADHSTGTKVSSIYHSHHPSLPHFFTPRIKSFVHKSSFSSGLTPRTPQTVTGTSDHIRFLFFLVFLSHFPTFYFLVPCGRFSWLLFIC